MTESELALLEDQETAIVHIDTSPYEGRPINRDLVVSFADTLMGVHPAAEEIGIRGMRTVAQLALVTGANPLPGTNGIHAWQSKGKLCIQFGVGYWRGKVERAGGLLWISRPRIMDGEERKDYAIAEDQKASICMAALTKDVFSLIARARDFDLDLSFTDAKNEVARVGIGTVNKGEYDKNGRPAQWTADLRAERDLYRKLVPALVPEVERAQNGEHVSGGHDWNLGEYTNEHLDRPQLPDDYSIEDGNSDFFEEVDTTTSEIIEAEVLQEPDPETPAANGEEAAKRVTIPMLKDLHIMGQKAYGVEEWNSITADLHAGYGTSSSKEWTWNQYWEVRKPIEAKIEESES